MRHLVVLMPLLALALAACGPAKEPTYSVEKTKQCLRDKGAKIGGKLDFVASTATGGAFHVTLPANELTIAFGDNTGDAQQIEKAYVRFHSANVGIEDILKRLSNAVMLWRQHPEQTDLETVESCLLS
jgi:hypothetical protein